MLKPKKFFFPTLIIAAAIGIYVGNYQVSKSFGSTEQSILGVATAEKFLNDFNNALDDTKDVLVHKTKTIAAVQETDKRNDTQLNSDQDVSGQDTNSNSDPSSQGNQNNPAPTPTPTIIPSPTPTPQASPSPEPSPSPSAMPEPSRTVTIHLERTNPAVPNGHGEVTFVSHEHANGYWEFDVTATFVNLQPSTNYKMWTCKDGCSSSGSLDFTTDTQGNGSIANGRTTHPMWNHPMEAVKIWQVHPGGQIIHTETTCYMVGNEIPPCLTGAIAW